MGIKAKQVAGVTTLVVVVVVALSAYHVTTLVRLNFEETAGRGQMLAQAIFQRAKEVVAQGVTDPYEALRTDGGIRSIIESSTPNWPSVTYVAIVNNDGIAVEGFKGEWRAVIQSADRSSIDQQCEAPGLKL